jgi:hypothetical protein
MRNKKAQIYLVTAIIIVMVLSGIASIKTYAIATEQPRKITDISSELKEESYRIIDYGIYNNENLNTLLDSFDSNYSEYFLKKTENTNIVFIYGNKSDLYSVQYNEAYTGSVFATIGGVAPVWSAEDLTIINKTKINFYNNMVNVNILNKTFNFSVKDNEMFYFLITQEKDGERIIEKN